MSEPDADSNPDGSAIPPEALAAGQRTLAAIVFTDTAGFSKLMSKDEEGTLRLVGRDLDHMKAVCGAFGGQVLKSTGDGLLMLFTSAVQAVACALEIQRDFQKQNLELPKSERLRHRIGIHLGDVFQNGGDVMGDGVNIAARLQTEAVPGGICLSQTVYDVVHNRLPFYVNDLGARTLKNIGRVKAYQISPMESAGSGFRIGWYRWRPWVWAGTGLLALFVALVLVFKLGMHREWASFHRGQPGAYTLFPLPPSSSAKTATTSPSPAPALYPLPQAAPALSAGAGVQEVSEAEFRDACFQYMTKYDFDGMEAWIQEHNWPGKQTDTLKQTCPKLNHLFTWAHLQMQKYSLAKPLKVSGREKTAYYWPIPFGGVKLKIVPNEIQPGMPDDNKPKIVTLNSDQIQPLAMVGIIHTLLKEDVSPLDPLTLQLEQEMHLFIQTYHIVLPNRTVVPPAANPAAPNP
jgi:class 3 adenylate cyclase